MGEVFVCADDFGLSEAVNDGIERAHRDGVLQAASLMVAGGAEAAVFAPSLPELYAKVHSLMNAVLPAKLFHINLPAFRNNKIE